jgi:hypothetical protein
MPICLRLLPQDDLFAISFALDRAGSNMAAKIAMIAIGNMQFKQY